MFLRSSSKSTRTRQVFQGAALSAAALVMLALGSCRKQLENSPDKTPTTDTQVYEYTVRGVVAQLPGPMNDFAVRHEAIPEYRNLNGSLGMNSMQMEFPLGEGVTLDADIAAGDLVEMTFVVEYGEAMSYYATAVTELPPETVLDFSPLERPSGSE